MYAHRNGNVQIQNILLKHGLCTYNTYILRHHGGITEYLRVAIANYLQAWIEL